jgi:hypothetical protein
MRMMMTMTNACLYCLYKDEGLVMETKFWCSDGGGLDMCNKLPVYKRWLVHALYWAQLPQWPHCNILVL